MKKYYGLLVLFLILSISINNLSAQKMRQIDSLIIEMNKSEKVTEQLDLSIQISFLYRVINVDSAMLYCQKGIQYAKNTGVEKYLGPPNYMLGLLYYRIDSLDAAQSSFSTALEIYEKIERPDLMAKCYSVIGNVYKRRGNYEKALEYYIQVLKTYEETEYHKGIAIAYAHIGDMYLIQNNLDQAMLYFRKSLEKRLEFGITTDIESDYLNIGVVYNKKNDYDNALEYFNTALRIYEKNGDLEGMILIFHNVGELRFKLGDDQLAYESYMNALELSRKQGSSTLVGELTASLAAYFIKMKDYQKAIDYCIEGLGLAQQTNTLHPQTLILKQLSEAYDSLGDIQNSYHYYKQYTQIKDSIFNIESSGQIANMEAKYQSEKKEQENILLRKDNQIQTNIRNSFIAFSVLILLMILILFNRFRLKKKAHKKLLEKNIIISNQRDKLKESNATKDKFFSIISHDLRSPFSSILGFSDILYTDYYSYDDSERRKFISKIKSSSKSAYSLLENLLEWARSQTGGIKINKETLKLNKLVLDSIEPYKFNAISKKIDIIINIPGELSLFIDKNTSITFIGNIVNNAIKFTPNGGCITIESKADEDTVHLHFIDNGVGMSQDAIDKLFRIDENISTPGTNQEKGTGLGLILCKEFIEKNGGIISVKSKIGKGTEFKISLSK